MIDEVIFKNEERAAYALRSLYGQFGYIPYKMSKFEEYDLYVRNKDFLISDGIITFTDTNGKLLALKPDVTLSIVKNSKDNGKGVQKLYYSENVYRVAKGSRHFKEIMQTGLECIGNVGLYDVCEVLTLAVKSLLLLDTHCILDLSHAALVSALLKEATDSDMIRNELTDALARKSADAVDALGENGSITSAAVALVKALIAEYSDMDTAYAALSPYAVSSESKIALEELSATVRTLEELGYGKYININFSLFGNMRYYNGVLFKGYIQGIPDSVLSGGRYDGLMKRMGKQTGAIGFAVYLDAFERFGAVGREYDVDVLLLRDESASVPFVIETVEKLSKEGKRVLVQDSIPEDIRYRTLMKITGEGVVCENGND